MRNQLQLQDRAIELFKFMFEQRRPTIIRDLGAIGASSTLLREAGLKLPELISLQNVAGGMEEGVILDCPCEDNGDDFIINIARAVNVHAAISEADQAIVLLTISFNSLKVPLKVPIVAEAYRLIALKKVGGVGL